ncbi:MAG TPA: hypothetical protein VL974_10560 [Magnetospirillum sp.]|jgi:hypothetical protein|nr:hypothetical protein [Magnetospirillum sp.]
MRTAALALAGILLAGPATSQSPPGDNIEFDLALWRHQPDLPPDLVDTGALLVKRAASESLRRDDVALALTLRQWRDVAPDDHSPAQARVAAMGRRSTQ